MNAVDPKVTVVIPCFNGERFIGDALKSVLSQTFKELEVIVVDDGSSDGSREVIAHYQSDPRVARLAHDENRGIAAARNTGIRRAQGDYIAFLDQDDIWRQKKTAKQLQVMSEDTVGEIGLVFSDVEMLQDVNGRKKTWVAKAPPDIGDMGRMELMRLLFMRNFIPIVSAMVRRECFDRIGMFDESIRSGSDDYDLCFRIAREYRFAHIAEPLAARRVHGTNFTDVEKFYPDNLKILGKALDEVPELADLKARRLSELNFQRGNSFLSDGRMDEAKRAYQASWHFDRSNMKALIGMLLSNTGPLGRKLATNWFARGST